MSRIINYAKSLLNRKVDSENIIINGNFDVWQRGISFNKQGYTADRWFFSIFENEYDSQGATATKCMTNGVLDNNSYGISLTNTVSGCYYSLLYVVPTEDVLPHQGEDMSMSYYAMSPNLSLSGNIYSAMYYTPHEDDALQDKTIISGSIVNTAISSGWTQYYSSFTVPSNARTLIFEIRPETTTGLAGNSKINFSQAKLELGFIPTQLTHKSYASQLLSCEAFYQKVSYAEAIPQNAKKFTSSVKLNSKPRKMSKARVLIPNAKNKSRGVNNLAPYIRENSVFLDGDAANAQDNNIILDNIIIDNEIYPENRPLPPTGITSNTNLITSGLVIYWSGSTDNNSKISQYTINYGTEINSLNNSIDIPVSGNHYGGIVTSGSITNIDLSENYYFNITATNAIGESDPSNTMAHTFEGSPVSSGLQTFGASAIFENGVSNISWNYIFSTNSIPDKFIIETDTVSTFDSSIFSRHIKEYKLGDSLNTDIAYLNTNDSNFYHRIAPVISNLTGVYSNTITQSRSTATAINNIITYPRSDSVSVFWTAPYSDGGYSVTGYLLQYSADSGNIQNGSTVTIAAQGTSNSTNISSLTTNTTYYFRLAPLNYAGTGTWSLTSSETPGRSVATCSEPNSLSFGWDDELSFVGSSVTQSRNLSEQRIYSVHPGYSGDYSSSAYSLATLAWSAPTDNGGQSIAYYNILVDTVNTFDSTNLQSFNTNTFRINRLKLINKLTGNNSTTWYAKCAAVNASGTGLYSGAVSLTSTTPDIIPLNGQEFNYNFYNASISGCSLNHYYTINDRGSTIVSGISYTGIDCSSLSQYSSENIASSTSNKLKINNLDAGVNYGVGATYYNYHGLSNTGCATISTPNAIGSSFNSDTILLNGVSYKRTTAPLVNLLVKSPDSSAIGYPTLSGVIYSGDPSVYPNSNIKSTILYIDRYRRTRIGDNIYIPYRTRWALSDVSSELWQSTTAIVNVSGTQYTSTPVVHKLWDPLKKPQAPNFSVQRVRNDYIYFEVEKLLHTEEGRGEDSVNNMVLQTYYVDSENNYSLVKTISYQNLVGPGSPYVFTVDIDRVFGVNYSISPEIKHKFVFRTSNTTESSESTAFASTSLSNRSKRFEFIPFFRVVRSYANYGIYNTAETYTKPPIKGDSLMTWAPSSLMSLIENRPIYNIRLRSTGRLTMSNNDSRWPQGRSIASVRAALLTTPIYYGNYSAFTSSYYYRLAKEIDTDFEYYLKSYNIALELGSHNFNNYTQYTFTNGLVCNVSFIQKGNDIYGLWIEQV